MTLATERQQFAEQNCMSMDFVNWFFDEKKEGCGNAWFIMAAAMWEGWKGRANREAQPVAYTEQCEISNMQATGLYLRGFPDNSQGRNIPLYTAPPAPAVVNGRTAEGWMTEALLQKNVADALRKSLPAVPDKMTAVVKDEAEYANGWNACRAAMLAAAPEGGNDHDTRR